MTPFELRHKVAYAILMLQRSSTQEILIQLLNYENNLAALCSEAKITSFAEYKRIKTMYVVLLEVIRRRSDCPELIIAEKNLENRRISAKRSTLSLIK